MTTREIVDVNRIVNEFLRRAGATSPIGVRFIASLAQNAGLVVGHPDQLMRMLGELVSAACAAIGDEGTVSVSTQVIESSKLACPPGSAVPDAPSVVLRVSDTGPGLSTEAQLHAFEPFSQTTGEPRRRSVAYGIARANGWNIELQSDERGTIVSVCMPQVLAGDA